MLNRQFSKELYVRGYYSHYKSMNSASGGVFGSTTGFEMENPYDLAREKGIQEGVLPRTGAATAVWDIQAGVGKNGCRMPRAG